MRFHIVIIDVSEPVTNSDYKPSRVACIKVYIEVRDLCPSHLYLTELVDVIFEIFLQQEFIKDFFEQNPLSSLGIILCLDGKAKKVTSLSSNPTKHIQVMQSIEIGTVSLIIISIVIVRILILY